MWHSCPTTRNEAVYMSGNGNVAGFLYLQLYVYLYIYIVPPLGAFKSQLGGPILYPCCFISSSSPVILYIYIYMYVYSSCHLIVGVFARKMHFTTKFAMTALSKCVEMVYIYMNK